MRVTAKVPALLGRVESITLQVRCEDLPPGTAVDVTDVMLQPGDEPSGVAPHPSDIGSGVGARQYRNGVVTRPDQIIALGNPDAASPARITVRADGTVRVGGFRFGHVSGSAVADGEAGTATQGWGRVPTVTERSDLNARVDITNPAHVTVEWTDRL